MKLEFPLATAAGYPFAIVGPNHALAAIHPFVSTPAEIGKMVGSVLESEAGTHVVTQATQTDCTDVVLLTVREPFSRCVPLIPDDAAWPLFREAWVTQWDRKTKSATFVPVSPAHLNAYPLSPAVALPRVSNDVWFVRTDSGLYVWGVQLQTRHVGRPSRAWLDNATKPQAAAIGPDANHDGQVNFADVLLAAQKRLDINGDGRFDGDDFAAITEGMKK